MIVQSCQGLPLQHEYDMWMSADVWVNCDWKAELLVFPVEIIEMVSPEVFYVSRINPTVGIWGFLDEHHRWQLDLKQISYHVRT